jgi:Domain of unknown function (DUF5916)
LIVTRILRGGLLRVPPILLAGAALSAVPLALAVAAALCIMPVPLAAQASPPDAIGSVSDIDGPPPPVPPAVISRDDQGRATVRATRVTGQMSIDGVLDEAFYQTTESVSELIESLPTAGAEPTERTDAWIGFDDENVYVSARLWESAPESEWVANEMRRDASTIRSNDNFGVFLDTFYDRRNSIGFYVTPVGGVADLQMTNEGSPNFDWNPVVDIRTGRFDGGWTVEMAIPFKSIRYRSGREQIWGIQMRRVIIRKNEWSHLTLLPFSVTGTGPNAIMRVSMYGTLVGIEAPPPSRNLQVKPYAIGGLRTDLTVDPEVSNDVDGDAGLDVKYGITENLTADLTYNTDFAQVEVDEQQVNLTRFSLFFPEKREFFLEGRGIFDFAPSPGGGGGGGGSTPTLFYSRRIGLQGSDVVPILGGGRVTGKVGSFDVGALSIQTDDEPAVGAESTNFSVVRLRRDILSRSSVGLLFENRSRSATAPGSNQAYGVDASFAFLGDASLVTSYAKTRTEGREGNDESYQARFSYAGDEWGVQASHLLVGDDFNPEVGFVRRKGFRQSSLSGRFSPRPASIPWIRQISIQANLGYIENERVGFLESRDRGGSFGIDFESGDSFGFDYTDSYERLVGETPISGARIPAGRYGFHDFQASYSFGLQRRVSGVVSVERGTFYTGHVTGLGIGRGRIEVTPRLSVEPSVSFNWVDLPDQQQFDGQFDQHVARTRINYSFTPRMFLSGLIQYNSGSDSFSTNLRLRWEYAPGSEIFLVYTEDRDTDVMDRWSQLSNRGLVIKVNHLFRF